MWIDIGEIIGDQRMNTLKSEKNEILTLAGLLYYESWVKLYDTEKADQLNTIINNHIKKTHNVVCRTLSNISLKTDCLNSNTLGKSCIIHSECDDIITAKVIKYTNITKLHSLLYTKEYILDIEDSAEELNLNILLQQERIQFIDEDNQVVLNPHTTAFEFHEEVIGKFVTIDNVIFYKAISIDIQIIM